MTAARPVTPAGVARELLLVGLAAAVYGGVRAVTEGSAAQAVANAEAVDRIERSLGIAWEGAAQSLIAVFFQSNGSVVIDPDGAAGPLFEVPIALPLPEALNFIP